MKVACIQLSSGENYNKNFKEAIFYINQAIKKKADLIITPETTSIVTSDKKILYKNSYLMNKDTLVKEIKKISKKNKKWILIGSLAIKVKNKLRNRSILIGPKGRIVKYYDKINMFDVKISKTEQHKESKTFKAGSKLVTANLPWGRLGLTICYDLRFPEMSRSLALTGSEILVAPSAWVKGNMKEDHWITINKTRAIENGCYVISPDQVGNIYCGRSLVVDPYGKILLDMKKKQGIGFVDIDLKKVKQTRKILPLLKNRRTDVYSTL